MHSLGRYSKHIILKYISLIRMVHGQSPSFLPGMSSFFLVDTALPGFLCGKPGCCFWLVCMSRRRRNTCHSQPVRSKKRPLKFTSTNGRKFPACATISQSLTREHAPAQPNSPKHPRNRAASAAARDSLRLPRKTQPARSPLAPFPTPATRNARCAHVSPPWPRESTFATPPVATFPHTSTMIVQMHVSPHLPR